MLCSYLANSPEHYTEYILQSFKLKTIMHTLALACREIYTSDLQSQTCIMLNWELMRMYFPDNMNHRETLTVCMLSIIRNHVPLQHRAFETNDLLHNYEDPSFSVSFLFCNFHYYISLFLKHSNINERKSIWQLMKYHISSSVFRLVLIYQYSFIYTVWTKELLIPFYCYISIIY